VYLRTLCPKTQNRSFLYSQGNVIVFALALLADQLVLLMLPDQPLHIRRRSSLHITPAVAPVLYVIGHLNRILLGPLTGELGI
jgi:hypothetical protein